MSEINNYDPNPYDNVTIDEALAQIYDRVNDRTIRQMVTLLKNNITTLQQQVGYANTELEGVL